MSRPRYSIIPADALRDRRVTDLHIRVLAIMGAHSDQNGWLLLRQRTIAEQANRARETINRAIRDLSFWGYVRKRGRVGDDGRRVANYYQVVTDRLHPADVTGWSHAGDEHVTAHVTELNHGPCDAVGSQQLNDPFVKRPRPIGHNAGGKTKRRTIVDAARERLAEMEARR